MGGFMAYYYYIQLLPDFINTTILSLGLTGELQVKRDYRKRMATGKRPGTRDDRGTGGHRETTGNGWQLEAQGHRGRVATGKLPGTRSHRESRTGDEQRSGSHRGRVTTGDAWPPGIDRESTGDGWRLGDAWRLGIDWGRVSLGDGWPPETHLDWRRVTTKKPPRTHINRGRMATGNRPGMLRQISSIFSPLHSTIAPFLIWIPFRISRVTLEYIKVTFLLLREFPPNIRKVTPKYLESSLLVIKRRPLY